MHCSKGPLSNKTTHKTKITYFSSSAMNPLDEIQFNDLSYTIKPGLSIMIPSNTTYKIISKDSKSYRIFEKRRVLNYPGILDKSGKTSKKIIGNKFVIVWMGICSLNIFLMKLVEFFIRINTLSKLYWETIIRSIPPTSIEEWQQLYNKYKDAPDTDTDTDILNKFKRLFWLEYIHRIFRRFFYFIYLLGGSYLFLARSPSTRIKKQVLIIGVLVALQGLLGFYMVKIGLVHREDLSHYRFTPDFTLALILFSFTFWIVLENYYGKTIFINFTHLTWSIPFLFSLIALIFLEIVCHAISTNNDENATWPVDEFFPVLSVARVPLYLLLSYSMWASRRAHALRLQMGVTGGSKILFRAVLWSRIILIITSLLLDMKELDFVKIETIYIPFLDLLGIFFLPITFINELF
jgi:heme A synthase